MAVSKVIPVVASHCIESVFVFVFVLSSVRPLVRLLLCRGERIFFAKKRVRPRFQRGRRASPTGFSRTFRMILLIARVVLVVSPKALSALRTYSRGIPQRFDSRRQSKEQGCECREPHVHKVCPLARGARSFHVLCSFSSRIDSKLLGWFVASASASSENSGLFLATII
jgi:hypothetical protein